MFGNFLDFISNFHHENEKAVHFIRKQIYYEKFPAGHYDLKISCDHPVIWSDGFSRPANYTAP